MAAEGGAQRPTQDVVRHTLVYGSGYITIAATSFVLVPVYTHHLSPSEFGLLALMLVFYGLLTQVYDLGLTQSVARFFFDDGGGRNESLPSVRATSLAFVLGYGGLLTAVLCLSAGTWADLLTGDSGHADLVRIVAATLYAEALAMVPLTLIRMQERSVLFVAITVCRLVATLSLNILFVVGLGLGVRGVLMGNAIAAGAVLLLLLPQYRHAFQGRPSRALLREMLGFGLPFFPVLLSGWLIDASDRYLLELFRSRAEVGYYGLAYKIGQVMQIAVLAFSMGWAPLRYRIFERPDAPDVYRRLTSYYVLAAGVLGVGIALFAREIVALVSPPSYAPAADVVPLIVLAYALYGLYIMSVTGMGVSKKTAPMAWIGASAAVANIGLNLILIPPFGMEAAAATTVLANVILVAGGWFYSNRVYPIPYEWTRIAQIAAIAAVVVGAAALVSPGGTMAGIAWAAFAWAVFIAALVVTRTVHADELQAARRLIRQALVRLRGRPARRETVR